MLSQDTIAFRKGLIIFPSNSGAKAGYVFAATIQAELMQLGYMLDKDAFHLVGEQNRDWAVAYYNEIIGHIKKQLGADRNYTPFYRNFPTDVMGMSSFELFVNAILHYWSCGNWEPPQELKERGISFENTQFKMLKAGTEDAFNRIFTNLVSLNQSLTEDDKETVAWFIDNRRSSIKIPSFIPFKETLCILASKGLDVTVTNPTDVLRIAVYMSGGDVSLPAVPKAPKAKLKGSRQWYYDAQRAASVAEVAAFKFKKFSRPERRFLVNLLEKSNPLAQEMQTRVGRWLRLGEILHVGEFADKCPLTYAAFTNLRNQPAGNAAKGEKRQKVRTFMSRVNMALAEDFKSGVDTLAERPGEFVRKLDFLLRPEKVKAGWLGDQIAKAMKMSTSDSATKSIEERQIYVLDTLHRVGHKVSSKVLFELYNHFENRIRAGSPRSIFIKGKRSKMKTLQPLPPMDRDLVNTVRLKIVNTIRTRIASLSPIGKVWIDPRLKDVPLPFAMRSINTAIKTYVRGTRIPFDANAKVIRPFIHWNDEIGHVDLDLSAGLYDENLNNVTSVSFRNLKEFGCYHSGDIRHRHGPCAEYIDMEIDVLLNRGIRYVTMMVNNYDGKPMHSVKDCVFGLMPREFPQGNEIFVPKTITDCMGMANESATIVVCIIDLKDRNYIWADIESSGGFATIDSQSGTIVGVMQTLVNGGKMSVYDLLKLHAEERGTLIEGELSKSFNDGVTCLKWEDFVSDYAAVGQYMNA